MTAKTAPGIGLTDSELAVARLAVMGRSNEQIAGGLLVSVGTVQTHLRSAYAKTGTSDRVGLTNWLAGGQPRGERPGAPGE